MKKSNKQKTGAIETPIRYVVAYFRFSNSEADDIGHVKQQLRCYIEKLNNNPIWKIDRLSKIKKQYIPQISKGEIKKHKNAFSH